MDRLAATAEDVLEDIKAYLASDEGRRVRRALATTMIVAAPVVTRLPLFRASMLGRLVGLAGGTALLVQAAKWIRDWEPTEVRAAP